MESPLGSFPTCGLGHSLPIAPARKGVNPLEVQLDWGCPTEWTILSGQKRDPGILKCRGCSLCCWRLEMGHAPISLCFFVFLFYTCHGSAYFSFFFSFFFSFRPPVSRLLLVPQAARPRASSSPPRARRGSATPTTAASRRGTRLDLI